MKFLVWIALFIFQMTFVQNALAMSNARTLRQILKVYSTFQLANEAGTTAVKEATSLKSEWRDIENEILSETSAQLGWTAFGGSLEEVVDLIKIPHAEYPNWWLRPWYPQWDSLSFATVSIKGSCQNNIRWNEIVDAVKEDILKFDYTQVNQNSLAQSIGQVTAESVWVQFDKDIDPDHWSYSRVDQIYRFIDLNITNEMLNSDILKNEDSFLKIKEVLLRPYGKEEIKKVHSKGQFHYDKVKIEINCQSIIKPRKHSKDEMNCT